MNRLFVRFPVERPCRNHSQRRTRWGCCFTQGMSCQKCVDTASIDFLDQAVFRSIVKFYETKQYKKGHGLWTVVIRKRKPLKQTAGLKAADSILKKHPDHGETLCMKACLVAASGVF